MSTISLSFYGIYTDKFFRQNAIGSYRVVAFITTGMCVFSLATYRIYMLVKRSEFDRSSNGHLTVGSEVDYIRLSRRLSRDEEERLYILNVLDQASVAVVPNARKNDRERSSSMSTAK